jgi:hypothetical protein
MTRQGDSKIGFISFYMPNVNTTNASYERYNDSLANLKHMVEKLKKETDFIVAAGDLNIILDVETDAEKADAITYPHLIEEVFDFLGDCGLCDAYRFLYPDEKAFTFSPRGSNPHNVHRRLDYCFISEELLQYLESVSHIPCHLSDHKAVDVLLRFKERPRGRTFWRHDDALLEIPEYATAMKEAIAEGTQKYIKETETKLKEDSDPRKIWEYLKYHLGKESRKFSKEAAKQKEGVYRELTERLQELERDPICNKTELLEIRQKMDAFQYEKDKRIIIQSRVKFTENNEKPTNYFMRKIKENFRESNVIELVKDGAKLSKEQCNEEIFDFYKELYQKRKCSAPSSKLKKVLEDLPKLTPADTSRLARPITMAEVSTTLFQRMNDGKSPGSDGLTVAFYKKFWENLKEPFFKCLVASLKEGELTVSQKRSIIRLIQKKGKDPTTLKNWRPISLINCDTKIFSRLITARLEAVISKLCSPEQLAYIKGRSISEGNRTINYLIEYMSNGNEGLAVSFDFRSAFDSVDHGFIRTVLTKCGFPREFIELFNTLYNGAESAVMNNGMTTKYFPLERSCRQGDCLSAYLFILILEPLIRLIKEDHRILGLNPMKHNVKLSAYADDVNGFVRSEQELIAFIDCIDTFGLTSGLELNFDKTEALHIAKNPIQAFSDPKLQGIKLVNLLKVTGVTYGRPEDKKLIEKVNFESTLNKMRSNFNSWNQRDITILGRAMLAKYHGIALLQYLANCIEVPEWAIKGAKKMIYKFIYRGVDKITRRMASKPVDCGGINLPILDDIVAAAGIQWLRKARTCKDRLWAKFIQKDFTTLGGYGSLNNLRTTKDNDKQGFYEFNKYLFRCWHHLKNEEQMNETTFLSQTIWNNRRFSQRSKGTVHMLTGKHLSRQGYTRVGDFFDQDGRIIEGNGSELEGLPLQCKMEWRLAVKFIKKYTSTHKTEVTKGFSNRNELAQTKILNEHEIFLSEGDSETELEKLTQGATLRLLSRRRRDSTPYMKKLTDEFDLTEDDIKLCYSNIPQISLATKSRSFLFKLYAGMLYGNNKLHLFGYVDSKRCERCNNPEQDIMHLLTQCPAVEFFRQIIYSKLHRNFSRKEELLGCQEKSYSLILLNMNKFIYQRKFLQLPLNPYDFYAMLRNEKQIEETIALKSNKTSKHFRKWTSILSTGILD